MLEEQIVLDADFQKELKMTTHKKINSKTLIIDLKLQSKLIGIVKFVENTILPEEPIVLGVNVQKELRMTNLSNGMNKDQLQGLNLINKIIQGLNLINKIIQDLNLINKILLGEE